MQRGTVEKCKGSSPGHSETRTETNAEVKSRKTHTNYEGHYGTKKRFLNKDVNATLKRTGRWHRELKVTSRWKMKDRIVDEVEIEAFSRISYDCARKSEEQGGLPGRAELTDVTNCDLLLTRRLRRGGIVEF